MELGEAERLVTALHRRLLTITSGAAGKHFQGLRQAGKHFKGALSSRSQWQLANIDISFAIIRHITQASCEECLKNISVEIGAFVNEESTASTEIGEPESPVDSFPRIVVCDAADGGMERSFSLGLGQIVVKNTYIEVIDYQQPTRLTLSEGDSPRTCSETSECTAGSCSDVVASSGEATYDSPASLGWFHIGEAMVNEEVQTSSTVQYDSGTQTKDLQAFQVCEGLQVASCRGKFLGCECVADCEAVCGEEGIEPILPGRPAILGCDGDAVGILCPCFSFEDHLAKVKADIDALLIRYQACFEKLSFLDQCSETCDSGDVGTKVSGLWEAICEALSTLADAHRSEGSVGAALPYVDGDAIAALVPECPLLAVNVGRNALPPPPSGPPPLPPCGDDALDDDWACEEMCMESEFRHVPVAATVAACSVPDEFVEVLVAFHSDDMPTKRLTKGMMGKVERIICFGDAFIRFPGLGRVSVQVEKFCKFKVTVAPTASIPQLAS